VKVCQAFIVRIPGAYFGQSHNLEPLDIKGIDPATYIPLLQQGHVKADVRAADARVVGNSGIEFCQWREQLHSFFKTLPVF
jgi:hypothetical protein